MSMRDQIFFIQNFHACLHYEHNGVHYWLPVKQILMKISIQVGFVMEKKKCTNTAQTEILQRGLCHRGGSVDSINIHVVITVRIHQPHLSYNYDFCVFRYSDMWCCIVIVCCTILMQVRNVFDLREYGAGLNVGLGAEGVGIVAMQVRLYLDYNDTLRPRERSCIGIKGGCGFPPGRCRWRSLLLRRLEICMQPEVEASTHVKLYSYSRLLYFDHRCSQRFLSFSVRRFLFFRVKQKCIVRSGGQIRIMQQVHHFAGSSIL